MLMANSISTTTIATTIAVLTRSIMADHPLGFQDRPLKGSYNQHAELAGGQEHMSGADKVKNKIEDLGGRAKEAIGKGTGDVDTENEGRADQAKSSLKDAGEKVKDAFKK